MDAKKNKNDDVHLMKSLWVCERGLFSFLEIVISTESNKV